MKFKQLTCIESVHKDLIKFRRTRGVLDMTVLNFSKKIAVFYECLKNAQGTHFILHVLWSSI